MFSISRVTLKQIAELVGVSRGTVDRVMHNRGGVKPDVSEKVRLIADSLGYKPNIIGKALSFQKKPVSIGIVINGIGNAFFDDVLAGIESAKNEFSDFGIQLIVKSSKGYKVKRQLQLLDELEAMNVSGIAIAPINSEEIADKINKLNEKGIQTVVFNSDIENAKRLAFVGCDYKSSGKTAASLMGKFLGGKGDIAIVYGSDKMLGHKQRVEGFKSLIVSEYQDISILQTIECDDDDEVAYAKLTELFTAKQPTGIFFAAGGVEGGIKAVIHKKFEDKTKIITCDETPYIKQMLKEKTIDATIAQEPFTQGYLPIKIIFDSIISGNTPEKQIFFTKNEIKILENL